MISARHRLLLAGLWLAAACGRGPQTRVQVQGTVTSIGFDLAVRNAEVSIEWPRSLGGGNSILRTDRDGRYVAARTLRSPDLACGGLAVTVRAPGYASAYSQRPDTACGNGVLTIDFKLFPIPR